MHINSMEMKTIRGKISYKGIVASIAYRYETVMAPIMILAHGFGGSKEIFDDKLDELVERGFFVIAMDNAHCGERSQGDWQDAFAAPAGGFDLQKIRQAMKQSAEDLSALIDHFEHNVQCDTRRVAVLGISMGGYISYRLAVIDQRVKVITPMISSPFWGDTPSDDLMAVEDRSSFDSYVEKYEPVRNLQALAKIPILAQLGGQDKHLDSRKVVRLFEKLIRDHGAHPSSRAMLFEDLGHEDRADMFSRAVDFISAHV